MNTASRVTLDDYLSLEYPFNVLVDPDGGYVIEFPDLKGCLTQADTLDEVAPMAAEARALWIEAAYEHGINIPLPSYPEDYSGKFVLRLPRSLHRRLAESAEREGVSLNQYVVMLLSGGDAEQRITRAVEALARGANDADRADPPPADPSDVASHVSVP